MEKMNHSEKTAIVTEGPIGCWHTKIDVIQNLNSFLDFGFNKVFKKDFISQLEKNNVDFVAKLARYQWKILEKSYMFVRVESPPGSRNFKLAYIKCHRVFSFSKYFEKIMFRLNAIPNYVLVNFEEENPKRKKLRLSVIGKTDYEKAMDIHGHYGEPPLIMSIRMLDMWSANCLLNGGDDPNITDDDGNNSLHNLIVKHYEYKVLQGDEGENILISQEQEADRSSVINTFNRILSLINDVNAVNDYGQTALMLAAVNNDLDFVISLMKHPNIDLNFQEQEGKYTALHRAIYNNHPSIVSQLLTDHRVDCSLKNKFNQTPLMLAIDWEHDECENILRKHGAPEE
jgi:hypothetical protein